MDVLRLHQAALAAPGPSPAEEQEARIAKLEMVSQAVGGWRRGSEALLLPTKRCFD
jgi:hypothetical protein